MEHVTTNLQHLFQTAKKAVLETPSLHPNFSKLPIIVFSHLRWDFVTQRPQHIISRLAKTHKILFVEEPIQFDEQQENTAEIVHVAKNITVLKPRINSLDETKKLASLIQSATKKWEAPAPMLWFYSAMFVDVADELTSSFIVYDCMDELAAFKNAPQKLRQKEHMLLTLADVVFTGGKSLYESKKQHHSHVYCFPSSVDRAHFEIALQAKTQVPKDLSALPRPRVGFYGVVDERLDLELLADVAKKLMWVSFVVIGPIVKIDRASLPQAPNIHYLGGKNYGDLPKYLKGFDVAMMPFAMNTATKFISPTKTLEFMASQKPIVSTPIYDVKRDYSKEVSICGNAEEFASAISNYLHETDAQKQTRIQREKQVIEKTSWDSTVKKMSVIFADIFEQKSNHSYVADTENEAASLNQLQVATGGAA